MSPRPGDRGSGWPAVVLASTGVAVALVGADVDHPLRVAAVLWFLLVCPGLLPVRRLGTFGPGALVAVAVVASTTLEVLAAMALLLAGRWSPTALLAGLALLSAGWAAHDLRTSVPRRMSREVGA